MPWAKSAHVSLLCVCACASSEPKGGWNASHILSWRTCLNSNLQDDDGAYHGWYRPFRELVSPTSIPIFTFSLLLRSTSIHGWTLVPPYFTTVAMFFSLPLWDWYPGRRYCRKGISPLSGQTEVWGWNGCWNRFGAGEERVGWDAYRLGDIGVG